MASWIMILGQCPCSGGSRFPLGIFIGVVAALWVITSWAESVKKKEGTSRMLSKLGRLAVVVALSALVGLWWLGSWLWPKLKERGISMKALIAKVAVVVVLVAAVGIVLINKKARSTPAQPAEVAAPAVPAIPVAATALPRVLDLGSKSCIPCKMMAPILEQLKVEQAGKVQVDFIDVWQDKQAGQRYGINLIPTQIFFDGSGKEMFRHEGFMSKEDILAKCRELGFQLAEGATAAQPMPTTEESRNG